MEVYRLIVRKWVFHHVSRRDPEVTKRLHDIPYGQKYITMAEIAHRIEGPLPHIAEALCPIRPYNFDQSESALWVEELLQRIYKEVRCNNPETSLITTETKPM